MPTRIVVGGVANCGKSTLTASIYREMQARGINVGIHELDVFENTIPYILGIESWGQRIKVKSGDWANPRISQAITAFIRDKRHFVLGDLTGIIDGLLEKMVERADSAIAIGKDQQSLQNWLNFFKSQKIPVIIKVISYVSDVLPRCSFEDVIFVGNLKREVLQNSEIYEVVNRLLTS
ncbi:MAG: hypothetical protein A2998_03230 [Candidatus Staskawiczbacteria bacterium RIFCSPLOWO2_01_FULL_37_25b]|uniref:CobQ/CobB/MinD/ParA nucleotide binding domain-containing protein n=2 Tax=Candidatus Staskawicziibacteriota TaxID=1817916 RepID=A0A1G2HLR3_9BACT|nr:MAG: hypothetical protein A2812_02485 [Candidatus Staskawiczbacteria bacterium RIFCSPHIGHO2_01_FULL_36_16]OGZ71759.1 MAG: hypothetical protein A2998_03230 [Candidatus Staskawiczbacteria bacterium RIFCSPLOWO2_01_FULL_37_25b]